MGEVKTDHILTLLTKLLNGEEIYPQNQTLQEELNVGARTLVRYTQQIAAHFGDAIICEKKLIDSRAKRLTTYRFLKDDHDLVKVFRLLIASDNDNINWVLRLAYENDIKAFKNLSDDIKKNLSNHLAKHRDTFLMKNNPLEDTQNKFFNLLAAAVKNREYKTIDYEYDDIVTYQDAKCLKLIFTDNNWYLACEIKDERLILLRVAFIKKLQYCPNKPSSYQTIALKKYNSYFENMQNAMTLADTASQKAILQANKHIARYFKKEMKPFFISQRFIGESPDGGIIFSVNFTQSLEVLPFIKRWLPDLEIIEPRSLKEALKLDLQKALSVIDSS